MSQAPKREEQAQLSVAATKKAATGTTTKKDTIEDALELLDADRPKSFGQEMADLKKSLSILGEILDEMRAIQVKEEKKKQPTKTPA